MGSSKVLPPKTTKIKASRLTAADSTTKKKKSCLSLPPVLQAFLVAHLFAVVAYRRMSVSFYTPYSSIEDLMWTAGVMSKNENASGTKQQDAHIRGSDTAWFIEHLQRTAKRLPHQYANNVTHCSVTVLLMDPKVGFYDSSDHLYNALESAADYTPSDACFTIHTSTCLMEQWLSPGLNRSRNDATLDVWDRLVSENELSMTSALQNNGTTSSITSLSTASTTPHRTTQARALWAVQQNVHDRARPLLQQRLQQGRVRFHVLNHTKYGWKTCYNFYMTRNAWMDARYYVDEFVVADGGGRGGGADDDDGKDDVDSDLLLVMERWQHHSFLGAVWKFSSSASKEMMAAFDERQQGTYLSVRRQPNRTTFLDDGDQAAAWVEAEHAKFSPDVWKSLWNNPPPPRNGQQQQQQPYLGPPPPHMPYPLRYPFFPRDPKVGNGGLSIRSRKWMLRAIFACPHETFAHLPAHVQGVMSNCSAPADSPLYDDVYFGTILGVIGGTPNGISHVEASLFSTETVRPDFGSAAHQEALQRLGGDAWVKESEVQHKKYGRYFSLGTHLHLGRYYAGCPPLDVCKYAACHEKGGRRGNAKTWWKRGKVG